MVMKKEDMVLVFTIESVVIGVVLGFMIRPFNPRCDPLVKHILIQMLSNNVIATMRSALSASPEKFSCKSSR